jgi:hypothetical protein
MEMTRNQKSILREIAEGVFPPAETPDGSRRVWPRGGAFAVMVGGRNGGILRVGVRRGEDTSKVTFEAVGAGHRLPPAVRVDEGLIIPVKFS